MLKTKEILQKAFENEDPIVLEEIIKYTSLKYIGTTSNSMDLYINASKKYVESKIKSNLLSIKNAIFEIDKYTVRDVYINRVKHELKVEALSSKKNIGLINLDSLDIEKTNEMSGENDIVDELFEYESSVLQKTRVTLHLYNKALNKEWKEEINTSIIRNRMSLKRKPIYNQLKKLIDVKYEPHNNDTKEIIKLLGLN